MPKPKLIEIEIEIISKKWSREENVEKFIEAQFKKLIKLSPLKDFASSKISFGVAILLCSSQYIKKINAKFRNIDKSTDILSFGNLDEKIIQKHGLKKAIGNEKYIFLGDLILSYDDIMKDAKLQDKEFKNHLSHILLHGLLHLIGFDHEDEKLAKIMENTEIEILRKINIDNPYKIKHSS